MISEKEALILNSLLSSTPSIAYQYDIGNAEIHFLNKGIYNQLGYNQFEKDTISLNDFLQFMPANDQIRYVSHISFVLSGREKKFSSIEYRLKDKNKRWRWYKDSIFVLMTGSLVNKELMGYATDITSFRKKEETYQKEEIRLKTILDNTIEYYFFLDTELNIVSLNSNAKRYLYEKIKRNIFEGYSILEYLPIDSAKVFMEKFHYALTGTTIKYELNFINEYRGLKRYQFKYLPIKDKKGGITGVCLIMTDLTEIYSSNESLKELNRQLEARVSERTKELKEEVSQRKKTEEKLMIALDKEKELNELKTKFISMVSHEFRTPLTAISMSSQILEHYGEKYTISEKKTHYNKIKDAIQSLTNLLEGVLSLSRFETENFPFQPTLVNLELFVTNLIENYKSSYPENIFELHILNNGKNLQYLDTNLITHILENMINNSIKYSPSEKPISLDVVLKEKYIEFVVKDLGIGIPKEDQDQIFQSFYRGKNVGNISGTGLGLNLTKNFVELHGGKIHFTSTVNEGSQFYVIIPQ